MEGPEVRIRPATVDDSAQIRVVLGGSFAGNPKTDEAVMAWQYWDNPFGPARSWVAEAEGRVVAHYAGICLPGVIGGAPATLALGVDAATDPAFRGLGLFESLARAVYADAGAAGMPVTYCLPNPNSLRGFRKAGGQDLGRARALVAPLDSAWLARRLHLPTPLGRLARAPFRLGRGGGADMVADPPADLDDLWTRLASGYGNGVRRDRAWWDWRYVRRPGDGGYLFLEARRNGRLVGAAAARCRTDLGGPMLCLLELTAEDDRAARDLVGRLASTAAGPLGAVGIATTALAGTPIYRAARAAGLWPLPRRFEPAPMHVGVVDNLSRLPELTRQRWSLAWGDLDHI
ncbi:MAG TPA: GNAT family N-acetyltransferase [Acidimicrobiales bacterium]|nr:GNAT family N-acetyltransferase [Acidimicrobiales bacterium]